MALTKVPHGLSAHTNIVDGASSTAITIDADGNVGIGTSSPRSVTDYSVVGINGTSGSAIDFELGEALKTTLTQAASQFEINVIPALPLIFKTSNTERLRLDAKGGMGLGLAVNAGWTTDPILQVGPFAMASRATSSASLTDLGQLSTNQYWDGSNHKYIATGNSSIYTQNDGKHIFSGAPSGSAGGNITYVTGVTISAAGHVGIGTASPATSLHVNSGAAGVAARIETSAGQYTYQGSDSTGTYIEQVGTTAATRKFRLQNQDGSNNYTQLVIDGANRRIEVIPGLHVHDVGTVYTGNGIGKGTIHLDPASATNFAGNAITFGASDTGDGQSGQAGIYTRTDGTLGTEMLLSTTDSYAAGSKIGVKISNLGNVDLPRGYITSQVPAFNANHSANGYAPSNTVFAHNVVRYNNGGHFSASTYRFTAPVAGIYHFHFHTIYYGSNSNGHISLRKNGSGISGTNSHYSNNEGNLWQTINISSNLDLAQNDYVDVFSNSLGGASLLHGTTWNEFSGYLVG